MGQMCGATDVENTGVMRREPSCYGIQYVERISAVFLRPARAILNPDTGNKPMGTRIIPLRRP